jgi:divalent metal cation (Fe/Co/Zn/Cd) transporter
MAESLALVGSGATVLIDLSSSAVLVWRFRHPHGHVAAERRANLVAAFALSGLGVVLASFGVGRLVIGGSAHPSGASIGVAVASLVVLPLIAARKYACAARVPSRALEADAHITVIGASTAAFTLLGLAVTKAGLTLADPAAGLAVGVTAGFVGVWELRGLSHPT